VPYLAQQRDRVRALDPPSVAGKADEDHTDDVVWLQCAVGLELGEGEEESERSEAVRLASVSLRPPAPRLNSPSSFGAFQIDSTAPLRGFDLLRATAGLSEDDVRTMRRQFHRTRDVDVECASTARAPSTELVC
jgi:hypothetical protein